MIFLRVEGFVGYAAAWAVLGVGVGLMSPAYNALISKVVREGARHRLRSVPDQLGGSLATGSVDWGAIMGAIQPALPFAITAWVGLLAVIPVWLKFKLPADGKSADAQVEDL